MAYKFYQKARVTLFLTLPKDEKLLLDQDEDPNRKFVEDVFKKPDDFRKNL